MKRVIIESPYSGDVVSNMHYLDACMRDSLERGEAPFASHLIYTKYLDDTKEEERNKGIHAGFAWGSVADFVAVYIDNGISKGMEYGIENAKKNNLKVEYRSIEWQQLI